jgi:Tfp pilus assembly protein PilX
MVAALLALMLIAALVASVFLAAMEGTRMSGAAAGKELALTAAESAIETTIAAWSSLAPDQIGLQASRSSTVEGFGTPVTVTVTRLDSTLYWIVADASSLSSQSSAMRRMGAIVSVQVGADHSITIDRVGERWWSELF